MIFTVEVRRTRSRTYTSEIWGQAKEIPSLKVDRGILLLPLGVARDSFRPPSLVKLNNW